MLTGVTVVFLGGDARQLEVIEKCVELDAIVIVVGFDQIQDRLKEVRKAELTQELCAQADVLVLPVVGADDYGVVSSSFSKEKIVLQEQYIASLPKHVLVYTGMAKTYLKQMCTKYDLQLIELLERDDVAIYNSIPTAEGAVMMAIENTDITIHGSQCIVLGLGRTGFTLARTLQGLGASVKVGIRRSDHIARAVEMGWKPFLTTDFEDNVSDVDLIFNTIPTMIITAQIISKLPQRVVIIDLASAPGATDFRFAEKRGIKALLAPGLPGIVAPKTAGIIMANVLCQSVLEQISIRGDEK